MIIIDGNGKMSVATIEFNFRCLTLEYQLEGNN